MLVTYKQHVAQLGDNVPEHQSYFVFWVVTVDIHCHTESTCSFTWRSIDVSSVRVPSYLT